MTALSMRSGRKLAPGRWARPGSLAALLACAALAALAAPAGPNDEPHLAIMPRSAAERARVEAVTAPPTDFSRAQVFEANSGGVSTYVAQDGEDALSRPASPLPAADRLTFELGKELFRRAWVSAPSSTRAADGLGPLFNARACESCHLAGGRGQPPEAGRDAPSSLVLRISVPGSRDDAIAGIAEYVATRPDPTYGTQLQDRALPGLPPEYRLEVSYRDRTVALSGGEIARLRSPAYRVHDLGYGPLAPGAMLSPRLAPPIFGLGLLEAIPAADILAGADPEDADGDGISGRPNIVSSAEFAQPMLGRFGLKAGIATLREQTAAAFAADIGLSTPLFPDGFGDCSATQRACRAAADGGDAAHQGVEIGAAALDLVAAFVRQSGVPARRDADAPQVLHGKRMFHRAGCAA